MEDLQTQIDDITGNIDDLSSSQDDLSSSVDDHENRLSDAESVTSQIDPNRINQLDYPLLIKGLTLANLPLRLDYQSQSFTATGGQTVYNTKCHKPSTICS